MKALAIVTPLKVLMLVWLAGAVVFCLVIWKVCVTGLSTDERKERALDEINRG